MNISPEDQTLLLDIARRSIAATATKKPLPELPHETSFELQCGMGAFVTIRGLKGELRGCIGNVVAHSPLIETVREMAIAAASRDTRFAPISAAEVAGLKVEVSVLSPLEELKPEKVIVGKHGLIVRRGPNSGLLLPQVATENRMGREQFLAETCRKAGLPPDAWKVPATTIYGFSAQVFGDG
ncbi:MAG: AmmeMemoRadiSam system protein A [Planctomycetes bacterium]|nr:AmmeMemoRadiSam system protein A [Planctomycetota bacterium]NUQ34897.1 AmmeMemoRadiSam system protein A [Planctomycetaceae bacterium]